MKFDDVIQERVSGAIHLIVEKRKQEIIAAAVAEFDAAVRKAVGLAAFQLSTAFSISRDGPEM